MSINVFQHTVKMIAAHCAALNNTQVPSEKSAFWQEALALLAHWWTSATPQEQTQGIRWLNAQAKPNIGVSAWCFAQDNGVRPAHEVWPIACLIDQTCQNSEDENWANNKDVKTSVLARLVVACGQEEDRKDMRAFSEPTPHSKIPKMHFILKHFYDDIDPDTAAKVSTVLTHVYYEHPHVFPDLLRYVGPEYLEQYHLDIPDGLNELMNRKMQKEFDAMTFDIFSFLGDLMDEDEDEADHEDEVDRDVSGGPKWVDVVQNHVPHATRLSKDVAKEIKDHWQKEYSIAHIPIATHEFLVGLFARHHPTQMHAVLPSLWGVQHENQDIPQWLLRACADHVPERLHEYASYVGHAILQDLGRNKISATDLDQWIRQGHTLNALSHVQKIVRATPMDVDVCSVFADAPKEWKKIFAESMSSPHMCAHKASLVDNMPDVWAKHLDMLTAFAQSTQPNPSSLSAPFSVQNEKSFQSNVLAQEFMTFVQKSILHNNVPQPSLKRTGSVRKM